MFQPNEVSEMLFKANGAFFDSAVKLSTVAMEAQSQMARRQMALVERCMKAGNQQLAIMKDVRDGAEFISKSSELATDFGQEVATLMRESVEAQAEVVNSFMTALKPQPEEVAQPAAKKPGRKASA